MNSSLGDFEVDLSAEFLNIKMKLNKLLSMQPGSILEIGDILDTSIFLVSQDKIIAMGELVVVDNKLALTIKDVFLKNPYLKEDTSQLRVEHPSIKPINSDTVSDPFAEPATEEEFSISNNSTDF